MRDEEADRAEFQIEVLEDRERCVLRLIGELDLDGCLEFERAVRWAQDGAATAILIDLDGLTFIDSTGVRILLLAHSRAARSPRPLRFTRGKGQVAKIMDLTGLNRVLEFADGQESAAPS